MPQMQEEAVKTTPMRRAAWIEIADKATHSHLEGLDPEWAYRIHNLVEDIEELESQLDRGDPYRLPPPEFEKVIIGIKSDGTKVYAYRISEENAKVLFLGEDEVPLIAEKNKRIEELEAELDEIQFMKDLYND
jgi:hypothetical protein